MAKKGGLPENLKPFKKGFDERRNLAGNPGSQSLKAIFERLLSKRIKVEEDGAVIEITRKEAIALNVIIDAHVDEDPNIRLKAAKMIFDNTDPITKDISLTTQNIEGDKTLTPEQAAKILKIAGGE